MNLIEDIVIKMMKIKKMGRLNYDLIFFVYEYRTYKQIEQKITTTRCLLIFTRHLGISKKREYKKDNVDK